MSEDKNEKISIGKGGMYVGGSISNIKDSAIGPGAVKTGDNSQVQTGDGKQLVEQTVTQNIGDEIIEETPLLYDDLMAQFEPFLEELYKDADLHYKDKNGIHDAMKVLQGATAKWEGEKPANQVAKDVFDADAAIKAHMTWYQKALDWIQQAVKPAADAVSEAAQGAVGTLATAKYAQLVAFLVSFVALI